MLRERSFVVLGAWHNTIHKMTKELELSVAIHNVKIVFLFNNKTYFNPNNYV